MDAQRYGQPGPRPGLHHTLQVWRRRRWLGLLIFAGILLPGMSFVASLPDVYRSTAAVLVERQQVPESFVRPAVTDELETRLHAISEEILGRARLGDLIERFGLYPNLRDKAAPEDLVRRMRRDIQMELKGADRTWGRGEAVAFELSYRGTDPVRVTGVANALASLYVQENVRARERQATRTAEFLKSQLEEMRKKLETEERRVSDFNRRHSGELPQQLEANLASLERLNSQLQLNSERQIRAMERRDRLLRPPAEPAAAGPEGNAGDDHVRLERLKKELRDLRRGYSDRHPDVIRLELEIAVLGQQLAADGSAGGAEAGPGGASAAAAPTPAQESLRHAEEEIRALKREEADLRRTIAAYERRVEGAPQRKQELQELSRDYDTTKDLYTSLLKRYEEALSAASMEYGRAAEQFRVLDEALPPSAPVAPNRTWLAVMLLLLSFGAAVGGMAVAEQIDTSFHSADDLRAFTRLPVLASIPRIVTRRDHGRRILMRGAVALLFMAVVAGAAAASGYVAREHEQLVWILSGGGWAS